MKIIIAANRKFRGMATFAAEKAKLFGYEPILYDLGGLGFGEEFDVTAKELRSGGIPLCTWKPRLVGHARDNNAGWIAWMDADAFTIKPIDEVLTDDYDIGVTMRKPLERGSSVFPDIFGYLNAGVIFFNDTEKAREFIRKWEEKTLALEPQNDQYALNELVREATDLTEYDKVFTTDDDIRIKVFRGTVYNYYYFEWGVSDKAKILHFKSGKRRYYEKYRDEYSGAGGG